MSVAKTSEISASSSKSFEDAIQKGVSKMSETVKNIEGAWVKEQKVSSRTVRLLSTESR